MSLATVQREAVAFIKAKLPGLAQCEPYAAQIRPEEARAESLNPPAVLLYVQGGEVFTGNGGLLTIRAAFTAYCIAQFNDSEARRNLGAITLAERVAELVEGERFNLDCRVGSAVLKEIGNAHRLGLANQGLSAWFVEWEQSVIFGEKNWFEFEEREGLPHVPFEVWVAPAADGNVGPRELIGVSQEAR